VDPLEAALLAELTVLVLHVAMQAWLDSPAQESMADVVSRCFTRLRGALEVGAGRVV
jgi:hypothetical protein